MIWYREALGTCSSAFVLVHVAAAVLVKLAFPIARVVGVAVGATAVLGVRAAHHVRSRAENVTAGAASTSNT
jgi:hypothetical protein